MTAGPPRNPSQAFLDQIEEASETYAGNGYTVPTTPPLKLFEPATLDGTIPPPRRWIVEGLVPQGAVTMLGGDGGVGKTLLAQQLATAAVLGRDAG
mgnify:FL=1